VEQAVKEVLAGFAADGEASGDVGAGAEAALDGVANGFVFLLDFFADLDAGLIFLRGFFADVGEEIIENDGALVDAERQNEIGVHDAFVGIDHEVRIDPKIEGAALARGGHAGFGFGVRRERAGLQAGALEILDGVFGVLDHAAQAFVGVGDVVAAVEIVVQVDFPVAIQRVDAAVEIFHFFGELQRGDDFRNPAEKILQRRGAPVQIHEHKILPGVHLDGNEAIFRAVEIADAFKLDHTFESAIDSVGPAVVGAAELFRAALRLGDDGGGVMAADIVESAELVVIAARDDNGFAGNVRSEEISFFADLVDAADGLPGFCEDALLFEFVDARIEVPRRRNGPSVVEGIVGIVEIDEVVDVAFHEMLLGR